jgi:hypothetical protein
VEEVGPLVTGDEAGMPVQLGKPGREERGEAGRIAGEAAGPLASEGNDSEADSVGDEGQSSGREAVKPDLTWRLLKSLATLRTGIRCALSDQARVVHCVGVLVESGELSIGAVKELLPVLKEDECGLVRSMAR